MKTNFDVKNIGMYCGGAMWHPPVFDTIYTACAYLLPIVFVFFLYEGSVRLYEIILKKPIKNSRHLRLSVILLFVILFMMVAWVMSYGFLCGGTDF